MPQPNEPLAARWAEDFREKGARECREQFREAIARAIPKVSSIELPKPFTPDDAQDLFALMLRRNTELRAILSFSCALNKDVIELNMRLSTRDRTENELAKIQEMMLETTKRLIDEMRGA